MRFVRSPENKRVWCAAPRAAYNAPLAWRARTHTANRPSSSWGPSARSLHGMLQKCRSRRRQGGLDALAEEAYPNFARIARRALYRSPAWVFVALAREAPKLGVLARPQAHPHSPVAL